MRRGLAFLICSCERHVNAWEMFKGLKENTQKQFRVRFDHWIDGGSNNQRWFHGWNASQHSGRYTNLFVFKAEQDRVAQRLYGFLCNPRTSDRRFRLCVLAMHDTKLEDEVNPTVLDRMLAIWGRGDVITLLNNYENIEEDA